MVSFPEASQRFFTRAFDFQGRSPRAEYWWSYLMLMILYLVIGAVSAFLGAIGVILLVIFLLGIIIPSLAIIVRRLHDTDRSGWWFLIAIIPFIGSIVLLVFFCMEGTKGPNKFGEDPYGGHIGSTFS